MTQYNLAQTTKISFVLGIYPGYGHENTIWDDANKEWVTRTEEEIYSSIFWYIVDHEKEYGKVNFVVKPARCFYSVDHGCPRAGEVVYEFSSIYNPAYGDDPEEWFARVMLYAKKLSTYFKQKTCTVTIEGYENKPVQICYLKNDI